MATQKPWWMTNEFYSQLQTDNTEDNSTYWTQVAKDQEKTIKDITTKDTSSEGKVVDRTGLEKIDDANRKFATDSIIEIPTIATQPIQIPKNVKDYSEKYHKKFTENQNSNKTVNTFLDSIKSKGLWADYSGADRSFRTKGADGKTKYDWGAGAMNTLGNIANYGSMAMSFIKDKETANNSVNDTATSLRKTGQQALLMSGNPYAMIAGAVSMLSDKVGGTSSATKGLGTGNDIGNFLASQVPFLGFAGRKMGKQFESDELKGSSMYAWNSTADGLFGGSILFGRNKATNLTQTNNMQRSLATNILKDAKLDFIGAQDPRYYLAAQNELNGGYDQVGVAKQGAVLQFTKRTLSKYKVKKHQDGGSVNIDYVNSLYEQRPDLTQSQIEARNELWNTTQHTRDQYNKQIDDPSFLQDWEPSKQSWRDYWEQNQAKYQGDDDNIFNAIFGGDWDLTSDYFNSFYFNLMPNVEYNDDSELAQYYKTLNDEQIRNLYRNVYRIAANYRDPGIYKKGGQITNSAKNTTVKQTPDGNYEMELEKTIPFEEWVQQVPADYNSETYDLELFYNEAIRQAELGNMEPLIQLQRWLYAVTRPTEEERNFYLDMQLPDENGNMYYPFHTGSVIPIYDEEGRNTGEYVFVKLGDENTNSEIKPELDTYYSGKNGLLNTHRLSYEGDRYYYRLNKNQKLKEGGKVNVIPEGALHKNKHNLDKIDEKFDKSSVTTKGIPVIVESEGGEVIQQAEVERQEIIFRLEVTKKLEELSKEGTDKAAIEAGKLLVKEILYNTEDNTGEML